MPKTKAVKAQTLALGDVGTILEILNNPAIMSLIALLKGLFEKKPAPVQPVTVPTPAGGEPDFPDDTIPTPATVREVASVRLKVARIQLNKQRFPEAYTEDNKFGLMDKAGVEGGSKAIPYGSKVWLDLTAFDADGKEFLRDAVLSHGLAYETEHVIGDAFIRGAGAKANGEPKPWEQNDTDAVGHGVTAWKTSLGFLQQVKFFQEGTFECSGSVGGVASNTFTLKVS